jgi:DNA-binding NarL/FixJ family response regulator
VALADDQRLLRDGLRIILEAAPDLTVVGVADDGLGAVELAVAARPDVLLLDIRMPRLDGIEATRRIRAAAPDTRVVLLTTHDLPELAREGVRAGAVGFVLKDASAEELCAAVRGAARGQVLLQGQSAAQLLATLASGPSAPAAPPSGSAAARALGLTERERDVLGAIARGLTNAEIARALYIGEATVKTHINHLFAKLGARDRAHALVLAREHGLV